MLPWRWEWPVGWLFYPDLLAVLMDIFSRHGFFSIYGFWPSRSLFIHRGSIRRVSAHRSAVLDDSPFLFNKDRILRSNATLASTKLLPTSLPPRVGWSTPSCCQRCSGATTAPSSCGSRSESRATETQRLAVFPRVFFPVPFPRQRFFAYSVILRCTTSSDLIGFSIHSVGLSGLFYISTSVSILFFCNPSEHKSVWQAKI